MLKRNKQADQTEAAEMQRPATHFSGKWPGAGLA